MNLERKLYKIQPAYPSWKQVGLDVSCRPHWHALEL